MTPQNRGTDSDASLFKAQQQLLCESRALSTINTAARAGHAADRHDLRRTLCVFLSTLYSFTLDFSRTIDTINTNEHCYLDYKDTFIRTGISFFFSSGIA